MARKGSPRKAGRRSRSPLLERLEGRAVPATITVTSTADSGPGTLRAAIIQAEMTSDPDAIINFDQAVRGTITLQSALPDLTGAIDVNGPGAPVLTVARSGAAGVPDFRIFNVLPGAVVTISGLTVANGHVTGAGGGGIANAGTLNIDGAAITGNGSKGIHIPGSDTDGDGGGIFNQGTLTITNSAITGNSATSEGPATGSGGGIANESGALTIRDSIISGNAGGSGGGIFNFLGTAVVDLTAVVGNLAGQGGGLSNSGTLTLNSADIRLNRAQVGGGLFNGNKATVSNSTVFGNAAQERGGGLVNGDVSGITGTLTLTASTVVGNTTQGQGGGLFNTGTSTITNATFNGNAAVFTGGGIANSGALTIANATLSSNSAQSGGGIFNTGTGSSGSVPNNLTVLTSILAGGVGGTLVNSGGSGTSQGHNIFSDTPSVPLAPSDQINTDPLLAPLADNGGPTMTQALMPGSPAIDAGVTLTGVTTDQRGTTRPQGIAPDIGAFEVLATATVGLSGSPATVPAGQAATVTATVLGLDGAPRAGIPVTFQVVAGPDTGATGTTSPASGMTDANGVISFSFVGKGGVGTDTVVATAKLPEGVKVGATPVMVGFTAAPPTVVGVHRMGVHHQLTRLVLNFSATMNRPRAQYPNNYILTRIQPGHPGGHPIPVVSAHYDARTNAVTLAPIGGRLPLDATYQLTVIGTPPGGLTDASGVFLDGAGNGQPGSNFVTIINHSSLVLPVRTAGVRRLAARRLGT